jgi:serine/threonine protein kinase
MIRLVTDYGIEWPPRDYFGIQCVTSPPWAAPEVLDNLPYTRKSDVYSFGICIWSMYTRQLPYQDMELNDLVSSVTVDVHTPFPLSITIFSSFFSEVSSFQHSTHLS